MIKLRSSLQPRPYSSQAAEVLEQKSVGGTRKICGRFPKRRYLSGRVRSPEDGCSGAIERFFRGAVLLGVGLCGVAAGQDEGSGS